MSNVIEALKNAMQSANVPEDFRVHLIGYFCNEWNALLAAAPQVVADERYSSCLATIRDLDRISMKFAADLAGLPVVEGSRMRNVDYLARYSVLELVATWRSEWDENSLQRMPIDRAALQAAPVQAQEPVADIWTCTRMHDMGTVKDAKGEFIAQSYFKDMKTLTDRHNASFRAPVQPVAVPDGGAEKANFWFDCLYKCAKLLELDEHTPIPSGVVAAVEMLVASPAAQGDAETDMFLRGVIAALGALAPHCQHGDVIHDEIVRSVGKEALYRTAEPEDVVWAGLDPEFYAAIAAKAAS